MTRWTYLHILHTLAFTSVVTNGECPELCEFCPTPAYCLKCKNDRYGQLCDKQCIGCGEDGCETKSGRCITCKPGFYTPSCNVSCPSHCKSSQTGNIHCDRTTGECLEGCESSWWGTLCDRKCSETCSEQRCFLRDGSCALSCVSGWNGKFCQDRQRCSENCVNMECSVNGDCINGCKRGFYNPKCTDACADCLSCDIHGNCTRCEEGRHGELCEEMPFQKRALQTTTVIIVIVIIVPVAVVCSTLMLLCRRRIHLKCETYFVKTHNESFKRERNDDPEDDCVRSLTDETTLPSDTDVKCSEHTHQPKEDTNITETVRSNSEDTTSSPAAKRKLPDLRSAHPEPHTPETKLVTIGASFEDTSAGASVRKSQNFRANSEDTPSPTAAEGKPPDLRTKYEDTTTAPPADGEPSDLRTGRASSNSSPRHTGSSTTLGSGSVTPSATERKRPDLRRPLSENTPSLAPEWTRPNLRRVDIPRTRDDLRRPTISVGTPSTYSPPRDTRSSTTGGTASTLSSARDFGISTNYSSRAPYIKPRLMEKPLPPHYQRYRHT